MTGGQPFQGSQTLGVTHYILRDGLLVFKDADKGRFCLDPHDQPQVVLYPGEQQTVRQSDQLRQAGTTGHATQQHLVIRGTVVKHAGIPQGAQGAAPLLAGDQIAESVQGVTDPLPLIAAADHRQRGVGNLTQQPGDLLIERCQ